MIEIWQCIIMEHEVGLCQPNHVWLKKFFLKASENSKNMNDVPALHCSQQKDF